MRNLTLAALVSLMAGALGAVVVPQLAEAQTKPKAVGPNGRFRIVNPNQQTTAGQILLDTSTGQTWQICAMGKGGNMWCNLPKTSEFKFEALQQMMEPDERGN